MVYGTSPPQTLGTMTLLIVLRIIPTSDTTWMSFLENKTSGSALRASIGRRNNGELYFSTGAGLQSAISITDSDAWMVLAVTKTTGSTIPRMHKCLLGSVSNTHTNAGGALGNDTGTIATLRIGGVEDFANIRVAAAAEWNGTALSDADIEGIASAKTTQSIADLSPTWLVDDSDAFATDLAGTADRTSITGTADDADDPSGWVYGLGGGGTTYEKTGTVLSGARATGADVFTAAETGVAATATRAPAADVFEAAETGTSTTGARSTGADVFQATEAGTASAGARASAPDIFEAARAATATSGAIAAGGDVSEHSRAGTAPAGSKTTGQDASEFIESGTATSQTLGRGAAQAGFVSKLGTATTSTLVTGGDAYTATETGVAVTVTVVTGTDVYTAAETGLALTGTLPAGTSAKTSPTTYEKTGTAVTAASATAADVFEATETGTAVTRVLAAGVSTDAPAIPRWEITPGTRWNLDPQTDRWDVDPSERWEPVT